MSKQEQNIVNGIRQLGRQPIPVMHATVKSVDEPKQSCSVTDVDDIEIFNVRIKSVIDEKETGIVIFPSVGSSVAIARIAESNEFQVIAYSQFDKIIYKNDKTEFIQDEKFTLKNDKASLKDVLNDLISELKSAIIQTPSGAGSFSPTTTAKFDLIDNKINQLLDA